MTAPDGTWMSLSASNERDNLAGAQDLAALADVDVRASEYVVFDDGTLRISYTGIPPGLAITGEVDESTYSGLMRALDGFTGGPGEIHIDLAGVLYCDLAGLRAIVDLTGARGHSDVHASRRVVLHAIPSQLWAALRIVGWESTPGLVLHGRKGSMLSPPGGVTDGDLQARRLGEPHKATFEHQAAIPAMPSS
jgi:ABC-type transporter Mla MlaB component